MTLDAAEGMSVMEVAVGAGLSEILAECGGNAVCATCHVYVDPAFLFALPLISDSEDALLESTAAGRRAESRLACQIRVTAMLDGLVIHLPTRQV
jgi:2Fe-2S ferredoxin